MSEIKVGIPKPELVCDTCHRPSSVCNRGQARGGMFTHPIRGVMCIDCARAMLMAEDAGDRG